MAHVDMIRLTEVERDAQGRPVSALLAQWGGKAQRMTFRDGFWFARGEVR